MHCSRGSVSRGRIAARLVNVPKCLIGIEAGMTTQYVARALIALGQLRASNLTVPTMPTLRPKLRKVARRSFSMAIAFD